MPSTTTTRTRRTQAERTAETREALIGATVGLLQRVGYSGTTTERVAEEAGVSRGALRHHFPTRAQLMADVVSAVYEQEHATYQEMAATKGRGKRVSDWPSMLWEVLSRPSGVAVLEIIQASRSDAELAELVAPLQARLEQMSVAAMSERFGTDAGPERLAAIRFFVWAIRGLSIAQALTMDPTEIDRSVVFFQRMVEGAASVGIFDDVGDR